MSPSATCCASPVVVTPLNASFRLEGTTGTKRSPVPNGELAKLSPIFSKSTTEVSLSASSHLTPLTSAGCVSPSPLSAEDLETPPLAHAVANGGGAEDGENESLPALLARFSRPPPFPLEGEDGNGQQEEEGEEEEEEEAQERERERGPERRERELPEPARSAADAADDDETSSSSVQEALSSLALVDEA